jgi:hypothetical protein
VRGLKLLGVDVRGLKMSDKRTTVDAEQGHLIHTNHKNM